MICQNCNKTEARIRITRISGGQAEDLHVCPECAVIISPYHAKMAKKQKKELLSVESLLKEVLEEQGGGLVEEIVEAPATLPICPSCGLTFRAYKQTCMLGCPDCYDSFGELLARDIKRLHGTLEHKGERVSTPSAPEIDLQSRLRLLRDELEEAVTGEDFSRAAKLRDEIRRLQDTIREDHR
jgi:protein arginine kinase activator